VSEKVGAREGAEVRRAGERALLVRFRDVDLGRAVVRSRALRERLVESEPAAEVVLGAGNLLLRFDGAVGPEGLGAAEARLRSLLSEAAPDVDELLPSREHAFEVVFGGDAGPDLDAVAAATGLGADAVVGRLAAARLTVAFLGFSPGFPYLIGLPPELELPRRPSPRPRVPAGSVAIAGSFAGIYPSATPGGWHLVGRTEATLFDPTADPPARLAPGDTVRLAPRRP